MDAGTQFATYPSLRGRNVLITGGASGIGEALVGAFAEQGAQVLFLDILDEAANALIVGILKTHAGRPGILTPQYTHCDLTDIPALQRILANLLGRFPTIDVVINNAANDTRHPIEEVTPELWDRTLAVNLRHQFFVTQALLPGMKAQARGSVINMSSISWVIPGVGMPVYIAAKAAIIGLTRTLAHELGPHNIRVNAILPGAIHTERQKQTVLTEAYRAEVLGRQALKRMIEPVEVARLALFLAADDSAAITNGSHIIDAGWV